MLDAALRDGQQEWIDVNRTVRRGRRGRRSVKLAHRGWRPIRRGQRGWRLVRRENGMATAELAIAIPAAVFVSAALIAAVVAVSDQMLCIDAAREGARAAARGESDAVVTQIATEVAPDGAQVTISGGEESVTVTVTATYRPLDGRLGSFTVTGSATAQREPTSQDRAP